MPELKLDPVDPTKTRVQTRDGRDAEIYAIKEGQKYPIFGAHKGSDGMWHINQWCLDGRKYGGDYATRPIDLINTPVKVESWVNVYEWRDGSLVCGGAHTTKESADLVLDNRYACKRIEFEVRRGEGLE